MSKRVKKVFISYASNSFNQIKNLIERLKDDGVDTSCQQTGFHSASTYYLEQNLKDSSYNNILIICDSKYKEAYKEVLDAADVADVADMADGATDDAVVDAPIDWANTSNTANKNELIISPQIYETLDQNIKSKIILLVYEPSSIPDFLSSEQSIDFSNFEEGYRKLLLTIVNEDFVSPQSATESDLSKLPIIEYKGYVDVDIEKSSVSLGEKDKSRLKIVFSNITNNKITSIRVESTDQFVSDLKDTTWAKDEVDPKKNGVVITKHGACSYDYLKMLSGDSLTCNIQFNNYEQHFCMICLRVTNKTIYGLETVQLFNIITIGNTIITAHVETIA